MFDRETLIPGLDNNAARRIAHGAGIVVVVLSIAFLVMHMRENWSVLVSQDLRKVDLGLVVLSGGCYALSVLTTSLAWPAILKVLEMPLPARMGIAIGLTAQVGKYLPGNVMHYFGRAALAARQSITLAQSGTTTIVELAAAPIAATLYVLVCVLIEPSVKDTLAQLPVVWDVRAVLIPLAAAAFALWVLVRKFDISPYVSVRLWAGPVAALICSFGLAGLSFFFVIQAVTDGTSITWGSAGAVFALAWLAGFLVPGSPAGLGVREALIIAFLTPSLGVAPTIVCALMHRILTAAMDIVMALTGGLLMASASVGEGSREDAGDANEDLA